MTTLRVACPPIPGSPRSPRFATAYFDDLSFAADLTATLARQVYLAHTEPA